MAIEEVAKARARAAVAAATAAEPVTLPSTPAFNTIGEPLRDMFQAVSPGAELLVPVRLDIDGSKLLPAIEQTYTETVLWNAHESAATADSFAKLTRVEVGLPAAFEDAIAAQLKRAGKEALAAEEAETESGGSGGLSSAGGGVVTLELHVEHASGVELRDRVLWDTGRAEPTPEHFARQLCADLGVPELEGAVAVAIREQLLAVRAAGAPAELAIERRSEHLHAELAIEPGAPVVRTEREALDWSPLVSVEGGTDPNEWLKVEAKEAERRDRLRRRHSGGGAGDE